MAEQFDDAAFIWPTFRPNDADPTAGFVWNGMEPVDGTLSVEINSADNGNNSVRVRLLGSKDITVGGRVNRDGVGGVLMCTPDNGKKVIVPVVSGGSHASADSFEKTFGLGLERKGTIEVLWPGGVRNRLYDVKAGHEILFPEIPCSFDDPSLTFIQYRSCVSKSLSELKQQGVINRLQSQRFLNSAVRAFLKESRNR